MLISRQMNRCSRSMYVYTCCERTIAVIETKITELKVSSLDCDLYQKLIAARVMVVCKRVSATNFAKIHP